MSARRAGALAGESGLALLSALLAVALLTLIVVEMADSTLVHTHLSRNAGNALAAQLLARSAVVGAEALLIQDDKDNDVTSLDGMWNFPFVVPTANGSVSFEIDDEDGKLDLNWVADKDQRAALGKVFESAGVDPALLDAVEAWTAKADSVEGRSASEYCALPMPCEPRHQPLRSLDELRLIRGFDDGAIARLRPFVTAFGRKGDKGVNVNTARPEVLQAIGCEVKGGDFQPPPGGFAKSGDATACAGAKPGIRTTSKFFSIHAQGTVGDVTQRVDAIVQRNAQRATRLVWRERPVSDLSPEEAS